MLGGNHVTKLSEVTDMAITFRKRTFLNSASTDHDSYVHAVVESSGEGGYPWGTNMLTIADCRRIIQLEFFLGSKKAPRRSLAKINLLINTLTRFRDALAKESELIENFKKSK